MTITEAFLVAAVDYDGFAPLAVLLDRAAAESYARTCREQRAAKLSRDALALNAAWPKYPQTDVDMQGGESIHVYALPVLP